MSPETYEEYKVRVIDTITKKGDFLQIESGHWVYWESNPNGYLSAHDLRIIADHLDKLNKPINDDINAFFDELEAKSK